MDEREQIIKAAFDAVFTEGGYQYSDDNKSNAYGWFRDGWIVMEAHTRTPGVTPDAEAPIGSPEWELAMDLIPPKKENTQ